MKLNTLCSTYSQVERLLSNAAATYNNLGLDYKQEVFIGIYDESLQFRVEITIYGRKKEIY